MTHRNPVTTQHVGLAEDRSALGGALPRAGVSPFAETPDSQESLEAPDGLSELSEVEGAGERHASEIDLQIEADGLSIVDEDGLAGVADQTIDVPDEE